MKHKFTFAIVNLNLKFKEYSVTLTTLFCFYKILNIHCPGVISIIRGITARPWASRGAGG